MKSRPFSHLAILTALSIPTAIAETISIHSPDQQLHVHAGLDASGTFRYSLEGFGKTLSGVIGEHIVMARQLDMKLDFLPPGNDDATIVQDGEDGHYQTNRETHRVEKRKVSPTDIIKLQLAPGGGACVILEKPPTPQEPGSPPCPCAACSVAL